MNLPNEIRKICAAAGSSKIGNAIGDMLDREYDIDAPSERNTLLREALERLKTAAFLDQDRAT